jgi:hypothetical protein
MRRYDPLVAPTPSAWLALSEDERLEMVREYHRHIRLPNLDAHAVTHAVVENQLAEALAPAAAALRRLIADGLDRHEAIHAIGSVLTEHIWNLMNKPRSGGDPNAPYFAALEKLTAASWRNSG